MFMGYRPHRVSTNRIDRGARLKEIQRISSDSVDSLWYPMGLLRVYSCLSILYWFIQTSRRMIETPENLKCSTYPYKDPNFLLIISFIILTSSEEPWISVVYYLIHMSFSTDPWELSVILCLLWRHYVQQGSLGYPLDLL